MTWALSKPTKVCVLAITDSDCSAIESMEKADTDVSSNNISPEKKLSFLQIVFDRLDPNFIQSLLQKYRWSVEAALDELLQAEEARSYQEEQHRYKHTLSIVLT